MLLYPQLLFQNLLGWWWKYTFLYRIKWLLKENYLISNCSNCCFSQTVRTRLCHCREHMVIFFFIKKYFLIKISFSSVLKCMFYLKQSLWDHWIHWGKRTRLVIFFSSSVFNVLKAVISASAISSSLQKKEIILTVSACYWLNRVIMVYCKHAPHRFCKPPTLKTNNLPYHYLVKKGTVGVFHD